MADNSQQDEVSRQVEELLNKSIPYGDEDLEVPVICLSPQFGEDEEDEVPVLGPIPQYENYEMCVEMRDALNDTAPYMDIDGESVEIARRSVGVELDSLTHPNYRGCDDALSEVSVEVYDDTDEERIESARGIADDMEALADSIGLSPPRARLSRKALRELPIPSAPPVSEASSYEEEPKSLESLLSHLPSYDSPQARELQRPPTPFRKYADVAQGRPRQPHHMQKLLMQENDVYMHDAVDKFDDPAFRAELFEKYMDEQEDTVTMHVTREFDEEKLWRLLRSMVALEERPRILRLSHYLSNKRLGELIDLLLAPPTIVPQRASMIRLEVRNAKLTFKNLIGVLFKSKDTNRDVSVDDVYITCAYRRNTDETLERTMMSAREFLDIERRTIVHPFSYLSTIYATLRDRPHAQLTIRYHSRVSYHGGEMRRSVSLLFDQELFPAGVPRIRPAAQEVTDVHLFPVPKDALLTPYPYEHSRMAPQSLAYMIDELEMMSSYRKLQETTASAGQLHTDEEVRTQQEQNVNEMRRKLKEMAVRESKRHAYNSFNAHEHVSRSSSEEELGESRM